MVQKTDSIISYNIQKEVLVWSTSAQQEKKGLEGTQLGAISQDSDITSGVESLDQKEPGYDPITTNKTT